MTRCWNHKILSTIAALACVHGALAQSSRDADRSSGVVLSAPDTPTTEGVYTGRVFPVNALRGTLEIVASPEVRLNGKPDRLSPGSRIRNTDNMVTVPGSLHGAKFVVNYRRNAGGEIHDVWLLTPEEAKAKLPSMAASAPRGLGAIFAPKPEAKDNGNTAYDALPKWNPNTPR